MRDDLSIKVELTVGGEKRTILGGNVRQLDLALSPYGVEGELEFILQDDRDHGGGYRDDLIDAFVKDDPMDVVLSVRALRADTRELDELPEIVARALVTERSLVEQSYVREAASPVVLVRVYRVRFADAARVLWSQHRPHSLFIGKRLADVLDAERGAVEVDCLWDKLSVERPQIFVGLSGAEGPSFLDWVVWRIAVEGGLLHLHHDTGRYAIEGEKDSSGEVGVMHRDEVDVLRLEFDPISRATPRIVNLDAKIGGVRSLKAPLAAAGVCRDILARHRAPQGVDDDAALHGNQAPEAAAWLRVAFAKMPTVAVRPWDLIDVSTRGGFSAEMSQRASTWRVVSLNLRARSLARNADDRYLEPAGAFSIDLEVRAEPADSPTPRLPAYITPTYPGMVEGLVVSDVDGDEDVTYEFQKEDTGDERYRVKLHVFDDVEVAPEYSPEHGSGALYLPCAKGSRVLVALGFDRCHIARVLDWRTDARVLPETQGQHLFLGKSATSSTSLLHEYQDDKPVFRILRTNDKDTAVLRIEEGRLTIQVRESEE